MYHAPLSTDAVRWILRAVAPDGRALQPTGEFETTRATDLSRCGPLLHHYALDRGLTTSVSVQLAARWRQAHARAARSERVQVLIASLVATAGAEIGCRPLLLKGQALRQLLYPAPGVRPSRDVDILVGPGEARAFWEWLVDAGARPVERTRAGHHLARVCIETEHGEGAIEVHDRLVPKRIYGTRVAAGEGVHERARPLALTRELTIGTLAPEDHVVHLFMHAFHHAFYAFRLLQLVDVSYAMARWSTIDWERVSAAVDHGDVGPFARALAWWVAETTGERAPGITPDSPPPGARAVEVMLRRGTLPLGRGATFATQRSDRARAAALEVVRAARWARLARYRRRARVPVRSWPAPSSWLE